MCSAALWWWVIFGAMLLSGAFGGVVRYQWEKSEGNGKEGWTVFLVTGVAAALLVPLFLNTISSSLLADIPKNQEKMFLLIGFCVAAGAFAKQFISSMAKRALEISQRASEVANEALAVADAADTKARKADNRAVAMYKVLDLVKEENFVGALQEIEMVMATDQGNSEAWAWRGYCLKRTGDFAQAAEAMARALAEEGRPVYNWLYNLACYRCLAGADVNDVVSVLRQALEVATPQQREQVKADLQDEVDFATLRASQDFSLFVNSL